MLLIGEEWKADCRCAIARLGVSRRTKHIRRDAVAVRAKPRELTALREERVVTPDGFAASDVLDGVDRGIQRAATGRRRRTLATAQIETLEDLEEVGQEVRGPQRRHPVDF